MKSVNLRQKRTQGECTIQGLCTCYRSECNRTIFVTLKGVLMMEISIHARSLEHVIMLQYKVALK